MQLVCPIPRLDREEERDPVELLDPQRVSEVEYLTLCSMCKAVRHSTRNWVDLEDSKMALDFARRKVLPRISHGICPPCEVLFARGLNPSAPRH